MIPVGTRVQLAPHLDLWMRGARFGTVESYMRTGKAKSANGRLVIVPVAKVRLDKLPKKLVQIFVTDLSEVE